MSQTLRDARTYEEQRERFISPLNRPAFHLSARVGWMNDPNGFCYYQGKYHMFYQYYPYDSHWGPMHWGHAVSRDLLHWAYLPAVLAPDVSYDHAGCFSGSAVELPDGQHLLMYTGVSREMADNGALRDVQTQALAVGDGVNYRKYQHNPVLTSDDLPPGGSRVHFRDPKMWREADGSYRMVAVNLAEKGGGQVLLYRSEDGYHWAFVSVLAENRDRIGVMWECPDLFSLDGKDVLLASAQDMLPKGFEYHNGNGAFYLIGRVDHASGRFLEESDHAADYGIDFYAPQTVLTPDGRRVMIGWMQNWDTCNLHTPSTAWFGQMSLPRELHVKNGILYQTPLRELDALRRERVEHRDVTVENGEMTLPGVSGRTVDLEIALEAGDYARFAVWFAKNRDYHTGVSFRPHESVLKIDRKFSGSRRAIIHQRRAKVRHEHGRLKLRLILDRYSVEVFINDGEKVMSATLYTELNADEIAFFADGKATFSVTKYTLAD
ncbi:MAG: glycoside hydrolase family 32 protein [Oscillospiraceae bacterium]|nr:glycoside hydrolase family 32 protein [Oscillospiraceae bacterium]